MKRKKIITVLIITQFFFFNVTKGLDSATVTPPIGNLVKEGAKLPEAKKVAGKCAERAGKEVLKEVFNAFDFLCNICMLKSLAEDGYNTTEAIVDYARGRTQKNIESEQYTKKCKYLEAKKKFKDCIIKNARQEIGGHGYPKECEALGKMFAAMGGYKDTKAIAKIYKKVRKKYRRSFL